MDLEERVGPREVAHEADPREQQVGLESGDVGAVADARLEHADERKRAHRFPQRAARDAESLGERALGPQPRPRGELAGADQLLDLRDRLVGGAAREGAHQVSRQRYRAPGPGERRHASSRYRVVAVPVRICSVSPPATRSIAAVVSRQTRS